MSSSLDPDLESMSDQPIDASKVLPLPGRAARSPGPSSRSRRRRQRVPIVIIDRSALFRAGLTHILARSRFRITGGYTRLYELPENAFSDKDCIALIGLDNDTESVLSQVSSLSKQHACLRIIALSDQFDPGELLAVIEAGGGGYLIKDEICPDMLLKSIELVLLGGIVVPQGLTKLLRARVQLTLDPVSVESCLETVSESGPPQPANHAPQPDDLGRLSNREQIILMQLTQGASNKHIARELNIAEATVKVHVKSLLRKIRVSNRTQAAMWAIDHLRPEMRVKPQPFDSVHARTLETGSAT